MMAVPARRTLTPDEFFDWLTGQEGRYELVDGVPMAMTGANRRHDRIVVNGLVALGARLKGRKCHPFTADTAVRITSGNIRFPDFGIECGRPPDRSIAAAERRLVAEVFSPSSKTFDETEKLEEYKSVPGLDHILLIDPDWPQARLWWRDGEGPWQSRRESGLEAVVAFPALDVALPLAELYDGLEFQPRPMLVDVTPADLAEGRWKI
ncbi:MAG: Uma2 family endonuclease [Rhodospirillaceae bacterium]